MTGDVAGCASGSCNDCLNLVLTRADLLAAWEAADPDAVKHLFKAPRGSGNHPLVSLQWQLPLGVAGPGGGGEGGDLPLEVTAAPLLHRLPCWGYVFREAPTLRDGSVAPPQVMSQLPCSRCQNY